MLAQSRKFAANVATGFAISRLSDEILRMMGDHDAVSSIEAREELAKHATLQVPYYRAHRGAGFTDLPVVNKSFMHEAGHDFLNVATPAASLKRRATSGSTGVPFTVYFERSRGIRNQAAAVAGMAYAGGDSFGAVVRAKAWAKQSKKARFIHALKGDYPFNADHFDAASALSMGAWVLRRRGVSMQGYASYLEQALHAFEDNGVIFDEGDVVALVATSEPTTPYYWEAAKRLFGVDARARYSSMELGVIATTMSDSPDRYRIDMSTYHVEILKEDSDEPAEPGELGRLVITDLRNRAMPFLRYDTGDLARFELRTSGAPRLNTITDIRGRRLDTIVAGTERNPHRAHALAVWGPVAAIREIRQFQLRQHDVGRFTWVLNASPSSALERQLRAILDERIGDILECSFRYVEGVPVLASGKRQYFVNEIPDPLGFIAKQQQD